MKYRYALAFMFEAQDDPEARKIIKALEEVNAGFVSQATEVKLQRRYDDRPPESVPLD